MGNCYWRVAGEPGQLGQRGIPLVISHCKSSTSGTSREAVGAGAGGATLQQLELSRSR